MSAPTVPVPVRKPEPGERCVCGRLAVRVLLLRGGDTPQCGQAGKRVRR